MDMLQGRKTCLLSMFSFAMDVSPSQSPRLHHSHLSALINRDKTKLRVFERQMQKIATAYLGT